MDDVQDSPDYIDKIKECIRKIESIYLVIGKSMYDEPRDRLAYEINALIMAILEKDKPMYNYEQIKRELFTEQNQEKFLKVRDFVHKTLKTSGAIRLQEAIKRTYGDVWISAACVDRLVELGEIKEIPQQNIPMQHRIFVATQVMANG